MRALLLLLAALWSPYVAAQAAPSVTYGVNGGTLVPGSLSDVGSNYRTYSNNDSVPGGARLSDKHNARFGPSANADVYSNRRIGWAGVARALRWAGTAGLVIGAGSAIYDAWEAANVNPDGQGGWYEDQALSTFSSTGFCLFNTGCMNVNTFGYQGPYSSVDAARQAWELETLAFNGATKRFHQQSTSGTQTSVTLYWTKTSNGQLGSSTLTIHQVSKAGCYADGKYTGSALNGVCPGGQRAPLTGPQVQTRLDAAAASGAVRGGDVIREAIGYGYSVPLTDVEALPATGPLTVSSPSRTVTYTAPDGTTSTRSVPGTVYNITYNTNSFTYNVTETAPTPDGGTVSETKEPEPSCGLPGQPACQVKVDETGTPTATSPDLSVFDVLKGQDAQSVNEALSSVPEPSFGFIGAPPIVACRPVPLPGEMGEIDACNVVDTVRELMGFLWALAAAWISLGWIREAVNGG